MKDEDRNVIRSMPGLGGVELLEKRAMQVAARALAREEARAWDLYVAGYMAAISDGFTVDGAASCADALLAERRKRFAK